MIDERVVKIIDRPCGYGKTTDIIASFEKDRKYLVVVPFLDEVERVMGDSKVPFHQPLTDGDHKTKREHLEALLISGENIATTHALYADVAMMARQGLLDGYDIIIDEVLDVCAHVDGVKEKSFKQFYLDCGYAEVMDDGKVIPTEKWRVEAEEVDDTLKDNLFRLANAGMLYRVDGSFFMWALPTELLEAGLSFTVYTFMAEGSMFLAYLDRLGISYIHDVDPEADEAFRLATKELIDIRDIPSLKKVNLTFNGQQKGGLIGRKVSSALRDVRRYWLKDVPLDEVLITCAKQNWFQNGKGIDDVKSPRPGPFAVKARLFDGAIWIANTTRGTNKFIDKSHLIYLYDQHMNPFINRWLGLGENGVEKDSYALTELIQWVYRSRVRRGEPVTLYLPSVRMRRILEDYLSGTSRVRKTRRDTRWVLSGSKSPVERASEDESLEYSPPLVAY